LRRPAGSRSQDAAVAANFNIGGTVNVNLDGALAGVVTATACESGPALRGLGA
jgi:hypothetical protein